jgi:hypothetical protein
VSFRSRGLTACGRARRRVLRRAVPAWSLPRPAAGGCYRRYVAGRDLKELFRAFRGGDELAFRRAAQSIIEEEEAKHHVALARDLRRLLAGGEEERVVGDVSLPPPPVDPENGWPLAELRQPSTYLSDLVLHPSADERLRELTSEVSAWQQLAAAGVPRRRRVIFFGPPGCGKSTAAEALAAEMGVPLVVVRLEAVVSSYLGQTAANLRRLMDYAQSGTFVVLFDEFDALGRMRDDPTEHGEIKRVVNAFLQMLDTYEGNSMIVAATNHEGLLDPALWRRFDEVVEFPAPSVHQMRALLRLRFRGVATTRLDIDGAASLLRGLPHAAVERVTWAARRRSVIAGRATVDAADLRDAVEEVRNRPW